MLNRECSQSEVSESAGGCSGRGNGEMSKMFYNDGTRVTVTKTVFKGCIGDSFRTMVEFFRLNDTDGKGKSVITHGGYQTTTHLLTVVRFIRVPRICHTSFCNFSLDRQDDGWLCCQGEDQG